MEPIGRGGFAEVWKALGPGGFKAALKFVVLGDEAEQIESRALEFMKDIRHPHLVVAFGAWRNGSFLIIAMELADRTLHDRMGEVSRQGLNGIPCQELMGYMTDAADGIDFLNTPEHRIGSNEKTSIQHRDIKPKNMLLFGRRLKVADFGLAKVLENPVTGHTGPMTPEYAAPRVL